MTYALTFCRLWIDRLLCRRLRQSFLDLGFSQGAIEDAVFLGGRDCPVFNLTSCELQVNHGGGTLHSSQNIFHLVFEHVAEPFGPFFQFNVLPTSPAKGGGTLQCKHTTRLFLVLKTRPQVMLPSNLQLTARPWSGNELVQCSAIPGLNIDRERL